MSYRSLLANLIAQRVRTRYAELFFGVFWATARPIMMVVVFATLRQVSDASFGTSLPYSVYVLSGISLWFYFLEATSAAATGMRANASLTRKVYYPAVFNPIAPVVSGLVDLMVCFIPLAVLMYWFGVTPDWQIILLPVVILQCGLLALGIGMLFSALKLHSEDWDRFLALVLYVGLFVSPVIYAPAILPENALALYNVNPMSGTLLALRAILSSEIRFPLELFGYSCMFTIATLLIGTYCFKRAYRFQLDRI